MITKWEITIPELTGDEPRRAYVYVPDAWEEDQEERYPVLYMFDGHNVFYDEDATYGKSWGMLDYLEETEVPIIVAAVECNHNPDNGRLSEYTPFNFTDSHFGKVTARGRTTMDWLVNTFKPYVDEEFPTIPDRECTFIAGSSMGGLMSLYAVTQYNQVFSRAAALSPSLWVAPERLDWLLRWVQLDPNTVVYMDLGEEEMNFRGMKRQFSRVVNRLLDRRVLLNSRIVPGGDHSEGSWEKQVPFFMDTLLYGLV